jgi:hypothetical protein
MSKTKVSNPEPKRAAFASLIGIATLFLPALCRAHNGPATIRYLLESAMLRRPARQTPKRPFAVVRNERPRRAAESRAELLRTISTTRGE